MTSIEITPEEIIQLREKYPDECLIKINFTKARQNKNPNMPTHYLPVEIKRLVGGKYTPIMLKLLHQIVGSNARPATVKKSESDDDKQQQQNPRYVQVKYYKLTQEELEKTDYKPETFGKLLDINDKLVQALDIISTDYERAVNEQLIGDKHQAMTYKVTSKKVIFNIRQSERQMSDEETNLAKKGELDPSLEVTEDYKIVLDRPLYALRIPMDPETKRLGQKDFKTKALRHIVYDMNLRKKNGEITPATIWNATKTKRLPLDMDNCKHFITYCSLTSGLVNFKEVCISKSGISLTNEFRDLHVKHHKPMSTPLVSSEDLDQADEFGGSADTEVVVSDEPQESKKTKKTSKTSSRGKSTYDVDEDEERALSDGEPDDYEPQDEPDDEPETSEVPGGPVKTEADEVDATEEHLEEDLLEYSEEEVEEVKPKKKPAVKKPVKKPVKKSTK